MGMLKTCADGRTNLRRLADYLVIPAPDAVRHQAQAKARHAKMVRRNIIDTTPVPGPVEEYLWGKEGEKRALAQLPFNLHRQFDWAREMDETRRMAGHDKDARAGHPSPRWKHYVISPDPEDKISLPDLIALAFDWYQHFFGNSEAGVKGKLGTFQGVIVFHNDNANQIPHAHVVVNCTNLDNGKRIHISDAQNDALAYHLQDMCRERGFSAFDDTPSQEVSRRTLGSTPQERAGLPATQKQRGLLKRLAAAGVITKEEMAALGPEEKWRRGEVSETISRANERKRNGGAPRKENADKADKPGKPKADETTTAQPTAPAVTAQTQSGASVRPEATQPEPFARPKSARRPGPPESQPAPAYTPAENGDNKTVSARPFDEASALDELAEALKGKGAAVPGTGGLPHDAGLRTWPDRKPDTTPPPRQAQAAWKGKGGGKGLATPKQREFVKSLAARNVISQKEMAALGPEKKWTKAGVNALLNAHSNIAGHLELSKDTVYDTRRPSEQEVYRTNSERKILGRGVYGWKQEIRDAVKVAAATSTNEEGFFAQLASMGVGVEKKGGDYLYFHPDMHIGPDSTDAERKAATRKVYGRKCGQNFTPRGVESMQSLGSFREAWEQGAEDGGRFKLVGAFNFSKETFKNVTVAEAADAVGRYGIEILSDLVRIDKKSTGYPKRGAADAVERLEEEKMEKLRWIKDPQKRDECTREENARRDKVMAAAAHLGMWEYGHEDKEKVDRRTARTVALRRSGRKKLKRFKPLSPEELKAATPVMRGRHKAILQAERSGGRDDSGATSWGSRSSGGGRARSRGR